MARRNTWSAKQGPIREVSNDDEYNLTSNDIRKSIVLSLNAADEDWSNYRRRSSGGTAAQSFQQSRSRRTSKDGKSTLSCTRIFRVTTWEKRLLFGIRYFGY